MRIGIDLGGTKAEIAAFDAEGRERLRRRIPSPSGAYEGALAALAALVTDAERDLGVTATVGVGHPGVVDPATGVLRNAFATAFNDRPFKADLSRLLGREVRFENDANCLALSEAVDGAAAGFGVVFGVILGTGAGGGIVVDGKVLRGRHGLAGEWGHNPLPWMTAEEFPGLRCNCGRVGCLERFVSGPGMADDHERVTGSRKSPAEIAAAAAAGDAACAATLERHQSRLGRALAHVVNLVDPDVIVLGGGVSQLAHLYRAVPPVIAAHAYAGGSPPVVQALHGDSSGVRGAAMLWPASSPGRAVR